MSGYTKGPWTVYKVSQPMTIAGDVHQVCNGDRFPAAFVPAWDSPADAEALANAHLIAAAPDMYEALKEAHAFIADQYCDAESQALEGEYVSQEARPLWESICNSISKAEGK